MDIKNYYHIILFSFAVLLLVGQAAPLTKKQLMEEAIEKKIVDYTVLMEKKCESKIQKRALEIVDSLLIKEAQLKTVDTFERPVKPNKPKRPDVRAAKDTTQVMPLFDQ